MAAFAGHSLALLHAFLPGDDLRLFALRRETLHTSQGVFVAALPLLWRQAELTVALNRTGARAVVTSSRIDGVSHADIAMNAAAECFSIRHVCGFGDDLPEGMASLDRAIMAESKTNRPVIQDGRKAALVTELATGNRRLAHAPGLSGERA